MATIKPFAALRPRPDWAERICELPYDVLSSAEARALAAGNPLSFLHVSKPEIDLPADTDPYSAAVYARGRANFQHLIAQGALRCDVQPCFYLYRQTMAGHTQTGLVAGASCDEYQRGIIRKHELTRVDKEDDRARHIEALNAQTGPAFLVYRAVPELDALFQAGTARSPEVDFVARDGVRHSAWTISDPANIAAVERHFAAVPRLYIADGHHRSAAAARVSQQRGGAGGSDCFLAVIFPHDQMQILPYNRVLKDLNGRSPPALLKTLEGLFVITETGTAQPRGRHEFGLYLAGRWRTLRLRPDGVTTTDPFERLDVTLLQQYVLAPIFGIDDPRTSQRIHFVGGIRGTAELQRLVDSGQYACAFSMFPTSMEELMTIADGGGIMPPKSTWFEPKLRDAMFCHLLE